jgi:DNA-binding NarL/FixJ family response regulator
MRSMSFSAEEGRVQTDELGRTSARDGTRVTGGRAFVQTVHGSKLPGESDMAPAGTKHQILIGDANLLFREALRAALGGEADCEVAAEAKDGSWTVREARRTHPDIAILGSDIGEWETRRVTQMILGSVPSCRILWVANEENPSLLIDALSAGASGFITRTSSFDDLVVAIRCIHRGQVTFPRTMLQPLMNVLLGTQRARNKALGKFLSLTKREREVLAHLAEGVDNETIANRLDISSETVRTHVERILTKLGVHSRLEAAVMFMDADIFQNL